MNERMRNKILEISMEGTSHLLLLAQAIMTRRKYQAFRRAVLDYQHAVTQARLKNASISKEHGDNCSE